MEKERKYAFKKSYSNPDFSFDSIIPILDKRPIKSKQSKKPDKHPSFESCLKLNNSEKSTLREVERKKKRKPLYETLEELKNRGYYGEQMIGSKLLYIKTVPKTITELQVSEVDVETGEFELFPNPHFTNEFKSANNRKKTALNKFCDFYEPLYKKKEVTMLFMTFTGTNSSKIHFSELLDNIKYHLRDQLNRPIKGYFWALQVSEKLHVHYHLCIAIDRLEVRKIPKELKFEKLWGQRTQVTFIKKSIRGYLSKYLAKDSYRVVKHRSYGKSSKYI